MSASQKANSTAIVIGGSIAGCSAAAVLRNHYDRVVMVDRDELPSERKDRKGAPHAYQFHALTCMGREALEELLPGVTERAFQSGVPAHDPGKTLYCSKFGFLHLVETDKIVLLSSRLHLEWILRTRTREIEGIDVIEGVRVVGLRVTDGVATGVEVADGESQQTRTIDADLVVDASGRTSAAPEWLEKAGYPAPAETTVNAKWAYVTTYVRPTDEWDADYNVLYVSPTMRAAGRTPHVVAACGDKRVACGS